MKKFQGALLAILSFIFVFTSCSEDSSSANAERDLNLKVLQKPYSYINYSEGDYNLKHLM
jgi:hypothetical protein